MKTLAIILLAVTFAHAGVHIQEGDSPSISTMTVTGQIVLKDLTVLTSTSTLDHTGLYLPVATPFSKGVTVETPTNAEDITLFFTDDAITVTQLNAILTGSATPSVTWTVRHDSDRSATGTEVVTSGTATTSTSTGDEITSFDDATISAGSWVWLETTAQSGTVNSLSVSIEFTRD